MSGAGVAVDGAARAPVGFTTLGGPASIFADLDSMEAVAARHHEAYETGVGIAARIESTALTVGAADQESRTAAILRERLVEGAGGLRRLAERLLEHRGALRQAAERYRAAEQGAAAVMDAEDPRWDDLAAAWEARAADGLSVEEAEFILRAGAEVAGEKILAVPADLFVGGRADAVVTTLGGLGRWWRDKAAGQALAAPFGEATADYADWLTDLDPSLQLTPARAWGLIAALHVLADPSAQAPLEVVGEPQDHLGAPRALHGRLTQVADLLPRLSDGEGTVTVTQVRGVDGSDVWLVGLPGTQGGLLPQRGSDNWTDGAGSLDALGNESRRTAPGVARALEAAGVPPGAEVLLAGYSQGGVHAVNLASDPDFSAAYAVRGVMTVGSPSGNQATPGGVPVLEFASGQDAYTAGDGGPNPVGPWRATVTFDPEGPEAAPAPLTPGTASRAAWDDVSLWGGIPSAKAALLALGQDMDRTHDLGVYTRMIEDFEASDPADRAEVAGVHAALAGLATGAVVSSRTVRLRRRLQPAEDASRSPRTR